MLRFEEGYFERIWGGRKLETRFGKTIPPGKPIGESWLISDHDHHESVVAEGPLAGRTLRKLLEEDTPAILGSRAQLTIHGRFPLLLKLLDARDKLSVQVHPDDEAAKRLGEPDVGKTEMWHVLQADESSELICGLKPKAQRDSLADAVRNGSVEDLMLSFPVTPGTSVFVPAGTVHAIGAGIVLAEIQQNSDITYRLYDWGRLQDDGSPRELHVDKAMEVIDFDSDFGGPAKTLGYPLDGGQCEVLSACQYFAAESTELDGRTKRHTRGESFHILLGKTGDLTVSDGTDSMKLGRGQALLVPGSAPSYTVEGAGTWLTYYVPDIEKDVMAPLLKAGHDTEALSALGLAV